MNFPPPADYIAALLAALPKRLVGRVAAEAINAGPTCLCVRVTLDGHFAYDVNTTGLVIAFGLPGGTTLFNLVRRVGKSLVRCTCDKCGAYAYVRASKTEKGPWLCGACCAADR